MRGYLHILSGYGLNESIRARQGEHYRLGAAVKYSVGKTIQLLMGFWCVYLVFGGAFMLLGKIDPVAVYGTGETGVRAFLIDFVGLQDILYEVAKTKTINPTWWYMSSILILYALFPLFRFAASRKHKVLPMFAFLLIHLYAPDAAYRQYKTGAFFYMAAFYLGMLCSEYRLLDRLKNLSKESRCQRVLCNIALAVLLWIYTYEDRCRGELPYAVALILLFSSLFLEDGALLGKERVRKVLALLGKHSANVFMFHTFFLLYYPSFTYLAKIPVLIIPVFLGCMVALSAALEFVKKKLGYPKLEKWILGFFR